MLRKEGNVYVLDLFVNVPSGATTPIKYKPMEVHAINQVADGREQKKQVMFQQTVCFDRRKSERGKRVQGSRNRKTATRVIMGASSRHLPSERACMLFSA